MQIKVEIDLDDLFDLSFGEDINKEITDYVKSEIMKIVKKDARYKAYVNKKANEVLEGLVV